MKVIVLSSMPGSRREVLELPSGATLDDLKRAYRPELSVHRKSFKVPAKSEDPSRERSLITLVGKRPLAEQGVVDGVELVYKDLGAQIDYRTVFVVEYAGPIAFMLLYAMRPSFIYGSHAHFTPYGYAQKVYISLFLAHFVKRELETFLVHKFSRPTMPLRNIFKNSIYYWSFAAFIGYVLCNPKYTAASALQVNLGAVMMILFELLNLAVHVQLSGMRRADGDQSRDVPKGPLFALVCCPNYFFEVMSWVSFSIGTNLLSSWFFTAAGLLQMTPWALKKHSGYVKADPKNKKKKSIIPFII
ncbi:unnamed protein product [Phytomonas sp. EM1]|nr:unnamed protein product [Phytomonas sp. EM1]|eukprot:CCW64351.1 unnamed protein product [Phytomonas sp. isolate EM1]